MRRVISIGVLAVIVASVVAPLALTSAASVPVCCRAGGKHHCMGMSRLDGFRSTPSACPYRTVPAITSPVAVLIAAFVAKSTPLTGSGASVVPVLLYARTVFEGVPKRGPPRSSGNCSNADDLL